MINSVCSHSNGFVLWRRMKSVTVFILFMWVFGNFLWSWPVYLFIYVWISVLVFWIKSTFTLQMKAALNRICLIKFSKMLNLTVQIDVKQSVMFVVSFYSIEIFEFQKINNEKWSFQRNFRLLFTLQTSLTENQLTK